MLIGLMGPKGGGKDTVCGIIQEIVDPAPVRFAFADKLKEFAYALDPLIDLNFPPIDPKVGDTLKYVRRLSWIVDSYGWDEAKQFSDVRRLLQRLGTEAGRQVLRDDIWVSTIEASVGEAARTTGAVLTDVRFPNEIDLVRTLGGSLWRIDRPSAETGDPHPSEVAWRSATPDVVIINDGPLEALEAAVYAVLAETRTILPHS